MIRSDQWTFGCTVRLISVMLALTCVAGLAAQATPAVPTPSDPVQLQEWKRALDAEKGALDQEKDAFNAKYQRVEAGSPEAAQAADEQRRLLERITRYQSQLVDYTARVAALAPPPPPKPAPNGDPSVVDLSDIPGPHVVDPARVSGTPAAPPPPKRAAVEVPSPVPPEEFARELRELRQEYARRCLAGLCAQPSEGQLMREAIERYRRGFTAAEEAACKAAMVEVKALAEADFKAKFEVWRQLQEALKRGEEAIRADPLMRKAWDESEKFLRSAEQEADERIRKGLVLPEDRDLDYLFDHQRTVHVWPGPKNPQAPLTNPLVEEAKRQKVVQLIIWERRESERLLSLFKEDDTFLDALIQDMIRAPQPERDQAADQGPHN
jgi:hypothetical protein